MIGDIVWAATTTAALVLAVWSLGETEYEGEDEPWVYDWAEPDESEFQ